MSRPVVVTGRLTRRRRAFLHDLCRAGYIVFVQRGKEVTLWPTRVRLAPRRAPLINLDLLPRLPSRADLKQHGLRDYRCGTFNLAAGTS